MIHLNNIPRKELMPGIIGRYIHGVNTTFGYVNLKAGSILQEHFHVHEQITFVIEGELEMVIGGEIMLLKAGSIHVIPSNMSHSAVAKIDSVVIDVFSPTREDYRYT